jgi:hypothetical protein
MLCDRARAAVVAALVVVATKVQAQSVGGVLVDSTSTPASFVLVTLVTTGQTVLSDPRGQFRFGSVPAGEHLVRVRQIGFLPVERRLVARAPEPALRDTIHLRRIPVRIAAVSVTPGVDCTNTGFANAGSEALAELFEQLGMNAQRWALMAESDSLAVPYRRVTDRYAPDQSLVASVVDTVQIAPRRNTGYPPGGLLSRASDGRFSLRIPSIADIVDPAFQGSHCFRYAQQEQADGIAAHKIDFEPALGVAGVDTKGAVWLDVASLVLTRAEFSFTGVGRPRRDLSWFAPHVVVRYRVDASGRPRMTHSEMTQSLQQVVYGGAPIARTVMTYRPLATP